MWNYIWTINKFIAYSGALYITDSTVVFFVVKAMKNYVMQIVYYVKMNYINTFQRGPTWLAVLLTTPK